MLRMVFLRGLIQIFRWTFPTFLYGSRKTSARDANVSLTGEVLGKKLTDAVRVFQKGENNPYIWFMKWKWQSYSTLDLFKNIKFFTIAFLLVKANSMEICEEMYFPSFFKIMLISAFLFEFLRKMRGYPSSLWIYSNTYNPYPSNTKEE